MRTTSRWYRTGLAGATATLGVVAFSLLGTGAGTATAGTNGQQINYYSHDAYRQCTTGKNQDGTTVKNCTDFAVVSGSNRDEGYWWIGPVDITWYKVDGSTVQSTCNVPKSSNSDFFTCYEP